MDYTYLINYYNSIDKFNIAYPKITNIKFIDSSNDTNRSKIIINNTEYFYSVLGRFDSSNNFWEWGWSFENIKNKIYDTRNFLNYGLDITDYDEIIIKNILINSKIKITENINLDFILALSLVLLEPRKYLYIHKIIESKTITKYIILKKN